ncbi:MAG: inorganic phosphate transporter [Capsulimonadaceae bacterium]
MELFGQSVAAGAAVFLFFALLLALSFEFVNGFHDTANAVATVIYTRTLPPVPAVIWSGCWNLIGVLTSSGLVAYSIVALLPVELVLNVGSGAGFAMVFSLLISAIVWNLGTWYLGLPASSSHTLVGSIMGVGLANAVISGHSFGAGVNWSQAQSVFIPLLVSPIVGFAGSALLLLLMKATIKTPELFRPPADDKAAPPPWIRALLVLTCTGVSFSHGSNDGQKGMGLVMLILIGVIPGAFALNLDTKSSDIAKIASTSKVISARMRAHAPGVTLTPAESADTLSDFLKSSGKAEPKTFAAISVLTGQLATSLAGKSSFSGFSVVERSKMRSNVYLVSESLGKLDKKKKFADKAEDKLAIGYEKDLDRVTKFIQPWVKWAVAIALGCGTMIGWKRIVVTVGEKIGKEHLTYAQGASAELVAMATIGAASSFGLPVSTTHVLSSGVAGTMAANGSGLQAGTLRNILLAWVLTLPVCVFLGAMIFAMCLNFVLHVLHVH